MKDKIQAMQERMRIMYPAINSGGCGLFAYARVAMVGGKGVMLGKRKPSNMNEAGVQAIDSSPPHVIVEYEGLLFDAHSFHDPQDAQGDALDKGELAIMVLEGARNPKFWESGGLIENYGEYIYTTLGDIESILTQCGIPHAMRIV